jgi:organic hydroperoxide reductase OsmC/OhrA
MKTHHYSVTVQWTGNTGSGTSSYRGYERRHQISAGTKPPIPGSSDPAFRGDPAGWNPEELLVAAISACHQLWYLHLCAEAGIIVVDYVDGSGHFQIVTLRPKVRVAPGSDVTKARELHGPAHAKCFIANSVNFPVQHEAEIKTA